MLVQINEKDVYKVGVSYGWCDLVNKYIENKIKNEFNRCGNDAIVYEWIEPKKSSERKEKECKMKCLDQRMMMMQKKENTKPNCKRRKRRVNQKNRV